MILLESEESVGKTHFINEIGKILTLKDDIFTFECLNNSAGFELHGISSKWDNSSCGFIFQSFIKSKSNKPIIVLNNIETISNFNTNNFKDYNYSKAISSIIDLKENGEYFDIYYNIPINLNKTYIFLTTKELNEISESVIEKIKVFKINKIEHKNIINIINEKITTFSNNFNLTDKQKKSLIKNGLNSLDFIIKDLYYLFIKKNRDLDDKIIQLNDSDVNTILQKHKFNLLNSNNKYNGLFEIYDSKKITTSFDDIVGNNYIKEKMKNMVSNIKNKKLKKHGVIFYGNSGLGKTMMAKAIAKEANMNFLFTSASSFEAINPNELLKRLKNYLEKLELFHLL